MPTVTFNPTADVELINSSADTNFDSTSTLDVGNFGAASLRRSVMAFDTSSIPIGATITSATLQLTQTSQDIPAESQTVRLFKLLRAFVEAEATWNSYATGSAWSTAGAFGAGTDYDSSASATATTPANQTDGSTTTFASIPASMIAINGTTRFLVKQDTVEGVGFNRTSWYDRLNATVGSRPLLSVIYTTAAVGGSARRPGFRRTGVVAATRKPALARTGA